MFGKRHFLIKKPPPLLLEAETPPRFSAGDSVWRKFRCCGLFQPRRWAQPCRGPGVGTEPWSRWPSMADGEDPGHPLPPAAFYRPVSRWGCRWGRRREPDWLGTVASRLAFLIPPSSSRSPGKPDPALGLPGLATRSGSPLSSVFFFPFPLPFLIFFFLPPTLFIFFIFFNIIFK